SRLPAFRGVDAIGQALDHGVRVMGVTVHFVDEGVDSGPIVLQEAFDPVPYARDIAAVEKRVHEIEHRLLPQAVRLIAAGRVRIDAGLLAVRSNPDHVATLGEQEIEPIDLVCVNLYPFERTASRRGVSAEEVIENIDIGGPTLIRAAAKNHQFAAVVVTPESYDAVLEELRMSDGMLSEQTREALATDAFAYTARYDAAIARWFSEREDDFP